MSYFTDDEMSVDDLRGQVLDDTACRRCSYNLRGLAKDGRCPECGTAIGISICGDQLRFSHPRWLRQVSEGLMMILWGLLVSFIVATAAGIMMKSEPVIRQVFITLGSLVGVIGTWQMTTPDPSGIGEARGMTSRKIVRIAVMAGVAANVAQMVAGTGIGSLAVVAFGGLCGIVAIAGEFAKLHYIGVLAARIPDESLRGRANFLKWALAVCYGSVVALGIMAALVAVSAISGLATKGSAGAPFGPGAAMGGLMAVGCLMIPAAIAMIVFAIMALVLIYSTSKAIKAQIPVAIELWNRAAQRSKQASPTTNNAPPAAGPACPAMPAANHPRPPQSPTANQRPYF